MIPYGARLEAFKKSVIVYIEEQIKEGGYKNKPGDLLIINDMGYVTDDRYGKVKLRDCSAERLVCIADTLHFKPLEKLRQGTVVHKKIIDNNNKTEKKEDMNFEIKTDIPLPAKFAEKLEPKLKVSTTKSGRINYSNLPLRAMKKGDCIVLFENLPEEKISSRKYTAIAGIRRITTIMGLPNSFHVDMVEGNKICVWRVA